MSYQLSKFDEERLALTIVKWSEVAARLDMPYHEFEKDLAWVKEHIDYTVSGDSYAYGIFAEGSKEATAIVDIVYSKRAGPDVGWLKMLEITMGPEYAPSQVSSAEALLEIIRIYVAGILGTVGLTDVHKARVIKLYGHNDSLMQMLTSVQLHLATQNVEGKAVFTSKFEGRWLVIAVN